MKLILQKLIAQYSDYSRRQAESLIREGLVFVNGQMAELGQKADENDKVTVNGRDLFFNTKLAYFKLNKPIGYTCTNRDFPGENNIFELINEPERLFPIGRLDKNSRGLILLTNDGDLAQKLSHPRYEHEKIYQVTVRENLSSDDLKYVEREFLRGVDIGEGDGIVKVKRIKAESNNCFSITLTQGKKRQLRRMFGRIDLTVIDLLRTEISGIKLGNLPEGRYQPLSEAELAEIRKMK